ncbi:FxSxx-COOH cyclophane-containing RiPP peptide [Actinomadura sp. WAC 06369]|uniref:FxSxx-COOH cyclophane-containing RiPP peptide n=1 Tax=Actinomadura sp. WAC 06369 TaxID=2203193 RepID=UPI000F7B7B84|nr:FxSxx-COOH cyclophane-containing RiPP peptide [Actinomadura sp. WAC 06369]RSN48549.1 FXSXX-COOH protein [Actinomadura sp. WAC 06369]
MTTTDDHEAGGVLHGLPDLSRLPLDRLDARPGSVLHDCLSRIAAEAASPDDAAAGFNAVID